MTSYAVYNLWVGGVIMAVVVIFLIMAYWRDSGD